MKKNKFKKILKIILAIIIRLILNIIFFPLIIYLGIKEKLFYRRFIKKYKCRTFFVWSSRHNWGDFMKNNVLPFLDRSITPLQHPQKEKSKEFSDIQKALRPYGIIKPFIIKITGEKKPLIKSLHSKIYPFKKNIRKNKEIQEKIKIIINKELKTMKQPEMLKEYTKIKQHKDGFLRRWFANDYFELIVWQNKTVGFNGFQLCYNVRESERALSYIDGKFMHNAIDQGEDDPRKNATPILVKDGIFQKDKILNRFEKESVMIDKKVKDYVISKLKEYKG